ncbi:MAG: dynamin family protein [Actinobacteria bacterium]|nr:dynamin family protein [Actinomycetota bacterium]
MPESRNGTQLGRLAQSARELAGLSEMVAPHLAGRAEDLAARLEGGRFLISVVGEFKRGKSTLLNALLGRALLPTGVLPLTAVATEVAYGPERVYIHQLDGTAEEVAIERLAEFVTEDGNPGNERRVARAEVRVPAEILQPGATLVDTPGLGSVFRHNTEAAEAELIRTDGAVVVFSADAPFSEQERELLDALAERTAATFFVLNRIDHLAPGDLDQVRRFVEQGICDALGRKEPLFCLSARAALSAKHDGDEADLEASGFAAFEAAFRSFLAEDLVEARLGVARREVTRLAVLLEDASAVEEAALRHSAADLDARLRRFEQAAEEQRRAFDEDRVLLAHAVSTITTAVGERLAALATKPPAAAVQRVNEVAAASPLRDLDGVLRETVAALVRDEFEKVRLAEAARAEDAWRAAAAEFRARTQARVDAIRQTAEGIFELRLGTLQVPEVAEERERFFYLFLHLEGLNDQLARNVRRLLPPRVRRRRLTGAAHRELVSELDKHAGRARWDIAQRLDGVRLRFEAAMREQLREVIDGVFQAAGRAKKRRAAVSAELAGGEQRAGELRRLTAQARAAAEA